MNEMARALAQVRACLHHSQHEHNSLSLSSLIQVTAELEGVKAEMDEKGTSMTDAGEEERERVSRGCSYTTAPPAGPVVQIRQGLTRLRNECKQMEVQIGMVSVL